MASEGPESGEEEDERPSSAGFAHEKKGQAEQEPDRRVRRVEERAKERHQHKSRHKEKDKERRKNANLDTDRRHRGHDYDEHNREKHKRRDNADNNETREAHKRPRTSEAKGSEQLSAGFQGADAKGNRAKEGGREPADGERPNRQRGDRSDLSRGSDVHQQSNDRAIHRHSNLREKFYEKFGSGEHIHRKSESSLQSRQARADRDKKVPDKGGKSRSAGDRGSHVKQDQYVPAPKVNEEKESTEDAAHNDSGASVGPKSLEDVLRRRKELEEEAARPKFLSRKDREAIALERRKQQVQAVQVQVQAVRAASQQIAVGRIASNGAATSSAADKAKAAAAERKLEQQREHEQDLIRRQYLGTPLQRRRIAKASDKFKFNFEWDAKEDTYEAPLHQGSLLFGRGMRAGVDRRTQREEAALHEQSYLSKERHKRGEMTSAADVQADILRAQRASAVDDDPAAREKHWTQKAREEMTSRDWRIFREDHRISFKNAGANAPLPFRAWDEAPLPQPLRDAIADLGYIKPSAIQMASIPFGLRQRDVIGLAETGSGKTAAFVLPMLVYILQQPQMTEQIAADGPYALVMAPTRELAQQIDEETIKLAKYTSFRTCCIVGGASYEDQIGRLRRGAEIVVATPGRLLDCIRRTYAVLNQCNYVVLDEADRMIDLGFEPQVVDVLAAMPSSNLKPVDESDDLEMERTYRTTYMFSATMPTAVERIAKRYLRRPVTVTVGSAGKATESVSQKVEWCDKKTKPSLLLRTIDKFQHTQAEELLTSQDDGFKCIVFVNNRENSEEVYNALARSGKYNVGLLHGGKSQEQREETIKGFRVGDFDIMIATDVAGRGIDVKDVGMVLNYDMPHTIENYTHRIGRTGRAGNKGTAITFLTAADEKTFYDLKQLLDSSKAPVPPQLANHEACKIKPGSFDQSKKDTTIFAT
jgi:ATP-dependent RNA helicase DDX23/PRP28